MRDQYILELRLEDSNTDLYLQSVLEGDYPVVTCDIDKAKIFMYCDRIKYMSLLTKTLHPEQMRLLEMDGGCAIMERRPKYKKKDV